MPGINILKPYSLRIENKYYPVEFEKYGNIAELDNNIKQNITNEINSILIDAWGVFPADFIKKHILHENRLIIARINNQCIGFCAMSYKKIFDKKVHYIEFLVIKRDFQKSGIGSHLFYLILINDILKNLLVILLKPLEVMFITPNIRVLSRMAKFASFTYPNPYLANSEGRIIEADDLTWRMANKLIQHSDNPNRKINREGLVLENSYFNMPWLIYNNDNAPWHKNQKINKFAKRYLGYGNNEDKEFIVRAHINLFSLLRYLYHLIHK